MNPLFHLYQLQKIDTCLVINSNLINAIDKKLLNDINVKNSKLVLDAKDKALSELQTELSKIEDRISSKRIKMSQSESSLYGGTVRNPKELQDLQKEINSIKSVISELEEEQLQLLINIDSFEEDRKQAYEEYTLTKLDLDKENHTLIHEKNQLESDNNRLLEERGMIIAQIEPKMLVTYESLRQKKKGVAISKVEDQTCSICGATLTPAECQIAKSQNNNIQCPSCGRLLYAD